MSSKKPREEKTVDDIDWVIEEVPGKEGEQELCSISDARIYLGVSERGLNLILDENQVTRWEFGFGSTKLVERAVLDELRRLRPSRDNRVSPKQLLIEAFALLEQVQAGRVDAPAIANWLEAYQQLKD